MFDTRTRLLFFACRKDAAGAGATLKSAAPTSKKIGSGSRLRYTAYKYATQIRLRAEQFAISIPDHNYIDAKTLVQI